MPQNRLTGSSHNSKMEKGNKITEQELSFEAVPTMFMSNSTTAEG